jgi:prepilin-type N-terminal cleavage/methylation domain-containing protein
MRRRGYTLAELLASLAVGSLLAVLLLGLLAAQVRVARHATLRAAQADAMRVTTHVVGGEFRRMAAADLRAASADSVSVRAMRGMAVPCAAGGDPLAVRYRGERLPDPRKDSVLVLSAVLAERASRLADVQAASSAACGVGPGEVALMWTLEPPAESASVLLVFEAGSYYLTARALRYRLGAEGRQPVSSEVFIHPETRFLPGTPGALGMRLAAEPGRAVSFDLYLGGGPP